MSSSLAYALRMLILTMMLLLAMPVYAAPPVPASGRITRVAVQGTKRIEEAAVLAAIGMRQGELLTAEKVRRDLKSVYGTGFFRNVIVESVAEGDGVAVVFLVEEKPAIRDVKYEGNKKIDDDDIEEALNLRAFSVLNEAEVKKNISQIRDLYVEKGFYLVDIDVETVAVTDDSVELTFRIQENRKVIVQRVDFTGNDNLPASKIKRFLQIKEGGFAPWLTNTGHFRRDYLESDRQTVSAVFLEEGYVDVRVEQPKVYLSPDKRYIFVSYHIDEGEKYKIGSLDVEGDFAPEEGLTKEAVLEVIGGRKVADIQDELWRVEEGKKARPRSLEAKGPHMLSGDDFKYSAVHMVMSAIADLYSDQGYAFVNVVPYTNPNPEDTTVDITYDIEMGEKVRIGRINITGNDPTFDKVIRREILINEGDIYRGSLIRASRVRLERLGFFEEVNISTPRGDGENVLDVNVGVIEQPTGSFSLGLGYSNLENFVLTGNVSKNNFLGLGYIMSAAANISGLRRQGNISFVDPHFLDSKWTFSIHGFSITREFALNEYQRGGSVAIGRYLDERDDILLRAEYTMEDVGLTSLDAFRMRLLGGELYRNGFTSSIGLSLSVDKRNNRLFPTQGVFASASTAMAGGFRINDDKVLSIMGGQFNFVESRFNFRFYQPLIKDSDQLVLRFNSSLGWIVSTDGMPIPFIHRYRAGGINSVRGYNWYSLGPTIRSLQNEDPVRADDSLIVGGTQTWTNMLELEAPIIRAAGISGVVFFDAGNAFGDPYGGDNINPAHLRMAYGMGVRWRSPMGPMRFELGIPIKPREDEKKSVFDFSIGTNF
ncbi:MAG: outer membrane protein assembly factor BamA [Proteobacteria bacterium]|nr:outer membrane protein assembly factor BamA [Pseudomonadota bacterium]